MAKGKTGLYLEGWKFLVYLIVPIGASVYYNDPRRQKEAADYWQYVKYPSNPNVNMKEQIEELAQKQRQRQAYMEQMKELNRQAARTTAAATTTTTTSSEQQQQQATIEQTEASNRGWLRWIGLGRSSSSATKQESS